MLRMFGMVVELIEWSASGGQVCVCDEAYPCARSMRRSFDEQGERESAERNGELIGERQK